MQEFVAIPTYLIEELSPDKLRTLAYYIWIVKTVRPIKILERKDICLS